MARLTSELDAVRRIRNRNPKVGQRTLARRIHTRDFTPGTEDYTDSGLAGPNHATIYGRIRRIDKATRPSPLGLAV